MNVSPVRPPFVYPTNHIAKQNMASQFAHSLVLAFLLLSFVLSSNAQLSKKKVGNNECKDIQPGDKKYTEHAKLANITYYTLGAHYNRGNISGMLAYLDQNIVIQPPSSSGQELKGITAAETLFTQLYNWGVRVREIKFGYSCLSETSGQVYAVTELTQAGVSRNVVDSFSGYFADGKFIAQWLTFSSD